MKAYTASEIMREIRVKDLKYSTQLPYNLTKGIPVYVGSSGLLTTSSIDELRTFCKGNKCRVFFKTNFELYLIDELGNDIALPYDSKGLEYHLKLYKKYLKIPK